MTWEIDLWGRIKAGQEAKIAEFKLASLCWSAWFAILGSRKQLALAESSLQTLKELRCLLIRVMQKHPKYIWLLLM